jgi:hypothetical protein
MHLPTWFVRVIAFTTLVLASAAMGGWKWEIIPLH